ncbi:hypothetical protein G7B40_010875 [Aetokthonos hydrillicola Thurmond2011]|uniref:Uncharacterized protein n=1 Tax=Aetokthonos hydrillicola Thurmond2011 TaxID=2712845 RepID=A0AAP5I5C4_9CYAN|nr:hypothetical protein [Aetokthonos hydrillicola]MBO3459833.1 hypothetical protein [Aetokthonos hydrillicola CCALA 1050]MBW4584522.1 hypothetical protein [Aetokthonos hydrillicola CCALA 1050]MDR9895066.1 hypothetical protein [Aetokthonos hydrillicola Thurmond2011]
MKIIQAEEQELEALRNCGYWLNWIDVYGNLLGLATSVWLAHMICLPLFKNWA